MLALQIEQQQADGGQIKTKKGSGKRGDGSAYDFPEHESHLVHAEIELENFDAATGAKVSKPMIQTFYPQEFERMEKEGSFAFRKVTILHAPSQTSAETKERVKTSETNELIPQFRTGPLAGQPIVEVLEGKNVKQLKEIHKELYPDVDASKLDKSDVVKDITDIVGVYHTDLKEDLKQQYQNKLEALGLA